jgi:hypothetical protein
VTSAPVEQEIEPPVQTPQPVAKREATPRSHSIGRQFAPSKEPARRAPPTPAAHGNDAVALFSSDPNSRPYLLAALALAVLVLGSGTLLTVLARLRPERRRMA